MSICSEGLIPGVLYGTDDDGNVLKTMITVDKKQLGVELIKKGKSFENTVYELKIQGGTNTDRLLVTPRQAQFNACTFLFHFITTSFSNEYF